MWKFIHCSVLLTALVFLAAGRAPVSADPEAGSAKKRIETAFAKLPMAFEVNEGQTAATVDFLARGAGYLTYVAADAATVTLARPAGQQAGGVETIRMKLVAANRDAKPTGLAPLPGKRHYRIGSDAARWRTGIPTYARVRYNEVYPGIDLVYYGTAGQLEFDFIVHPDADPRIIRLVFDGVGDVALSAEGDLLLTAGGTRLQMRKPIAYQEHAGERIPVPCRFVVHHSQVAFEVGTYDSTRSLVIDPVVIAYSSYLGGSGHDVGNAITVDSAGNVYVTGETRSLDFPVTDTSQLQGDPTVGAVIDAFVTKIAADGSAILYSTYLGGTGTDRASGIAVGPAGNVYVAGETRSGDFPIVNAFQSEYRGDGDGFVVKLNAAGHIVFSTYLGGASLDRANAVAADALGSAYVTGHTFSSNFPTVNPLQPAPGQFGGDAFVTKFDSTGAVVYSTYLGGSSLDEGRAIAVDSLLQVHVAGRSSAPDFPSPPGTPAPAHAGGDDVFVAKIDVSGQALLYSTFLGGSAADLASGLGLDAPGNAYVGGLTESHDFPVTAGAFDATFGGSGRFDGFVAKLNPAGGVGYATYLGGSDFDSVFSVAVDADGNAYVTGGTLSADFPTLGAFDDTLRAVPGRLGGDAFVAKLNPAGSALVYSSYLGGNDQDAGFGIAVDTAGNAYVTGLTRSSDFPRVHALQPRPHQSPNSGFAEAFVVKIAEIP